MIGGISADMNLLQSLLFGLISGLSDILPVSSQAHKAMLLKLFGVNAEAPLMRLFIHAGILAALYYCCANQIMRYSRQLRLSRIPKKKRKRPLDIRTLMEFKLLKMMVIPVLLGLFFYQNTVAWGTKLQLMAIFLLINGAILFMPSLLPTGNKDARNMSSLNGLLIGVGGALSVIPGISAIGGANAVASACGADRTFSLNLTFLMNMVLTIALIAFDFAAVYASGANNLSFFVLLTYFISGVAAFGGAFLGIQTMRALAVNIGFNIFAFYSFGAALFSFVLYLMV